MQIIFVFGLVHTKFSLALIGVSQENGEIDLFKLVDCKVKYQGYICLIY